MKTERIKELFFLEATNYPFPSNELYLFFGFTRHDNFIKFLNKKDEYSNEITCKPWENVHLRRGNVYYITRDLFYTLSQKYLKDYSIINEIYLDYKHTILKSKILVFKNYLKSEYVHRIYRNKIKGHFYTYSLNTLNIAKDLNINVYDLFKFCSTDFCLNYGYQSAKCTNEYETKYEAAIPFYSFDHIQHENRDLFIQLLNVIKNKYKLSDFQKQILELYTKLIKQMLDKQLEYDFKEHRRGKKISTFTHKHFLTKEQQAGMKIIYRKAAMLCHPDKNKDGEEIFKELNMANKNNNLQRVKDIYTRLSKQV